MADENFPKEGVSGRPPTRTTCPDMRQRSSAPEVDVDSARLDAVQSGSDTRAAPTLLPARDDAHYTIAVAVAVDLCEQRFSKPSTIVAALVDELDILRNPRRMPTGGGRSDSGLFARPGPVKPGRLRRPASGHPPVGFAAQFHHCRREDHPEPCPGRRQDRSADPISAPGSPATRMPPDFYLAIGFVETGRVTTELGAGLRMYLNLTRN